SHVSAVPVAIGAFDPVRTADANVVGRGYSLAALVEADEEIELPLVLEDRGGLDRPSIAACERKRGRIVADQLAGRRIELSELDAWPERPESEEGAAVIEIDAERIAGVEAVARGR